MSSSFRSSRPSSSSWNWRLRVRCVIRPRRWSKAMAWSRISSKVMADPLPLWRLRQWRATSVKVWCHGARTPRVYQEYGGVARQIAQPCSNEVRTGSGQEAAAEEGDDDDNTHGHLLWDDVPWRRPPYQASCR